MNDHYWPTWAPAWEEEGVNTWQEGRKRQSKRQGSLANNWGLFKLEYHGVPSYHEAFEENNQNRNQRLEKYNNNCCGTNIHMFAKLLGTKKEITRIHIQIVQISNISTYLGIHYKPNKIIRSTGTAFWSWVWNKSVINILGRRNCQQASKNGKKKTMKHGSQYQSREEWARKNGPQWESSRSSTDWQGDDEKTGGSRGALEEVHQINQVVRRQAERRNMEKPFKRHPNAHNKREKTLPTDPSGTGEAKPRLPPSVRGWARRQKASMREMIVSGRGRRNKKQRLGWAINGRQRKGRTSPATCWRRHSLLKLTNSTIQRKGRPQSNRNIHQKNPKKGFDHREGASKDRYKRWHLPTWRSIPEAWSLTKKCEQRAKNKIKQQQQQDHPCNKPLVRAKGALWKQKHLRSYAYKQTHRITFKNRVWERIYHKVHYNRISTCPISACRNRPPAHGVQACSPRTLHRRESGACKQAVQLVPGLYLFQGTN